MTTRDDIFEQDLGERERYMEAGLDEEIKLPLTKDGFEALLEAATAVYHLPVDDGMRSVLAGYVHHIPNEENLITIEKLSKVLYKSVSNSTTWRIDQEIKAKARKEYEEKMKKESESNVLPIKQENMNEQPQVF